MKTFLVALFVAISAPLFAQQHKVVVPMWDEAGHQWYAAFPQTEIASAPQNLVFVHDTETVFSGTSGKGPHAEGNTTISGSLTVTGTTFLGTNAATPTYTFGPHYIGHAAPAASTSITILADETEIADAGGTVTITMPAAPPSSMSRRITIINESSTYNVTDGATVTVSPGSKLELTYDVTAGLWK